MLREENYSAGWLDSSIHDFVQGIEGPSSTIAFVLITALDSCTDLPAIAHGGHTFQGALKYKLIGEGLLMATRSLVEIVRQKRLFHGFDEVWFFPHKAIMPKPKQLSIVGPGKIDERQMPRLVEWMRENNCSLGLGDGVGLNLCVKVRGAGRHVLEALLDADADSYSNGHKVASAQGQKRRKE